MFSRCWSMTFSANALLDFMTRFTQGRHEPRGTSEAHAMRQRRRLVDKGARERLSIWDAYFFPPRMTSITEATMRPAPPSSHPSTGSATKAAPSSTATTGFT